PSRPLLEHAASSRVLPAKRPNCTAARPMIRGTRLVDAFDLERRSMTISSHVCSRVHEEPGHTSPRLDCAGVAGLPRTSAWIRRPALLKPIKALAARARVREGYAMGRLIEGKWTNEWYTPDAEGRFVRGVTTFRDRITADGSSGFPA